MSSTTFSNFISKLLYFELILELILNILFLLAGLHPCRSATEDLFDMRVIIYWAYTQALRVIEHLLPTNNNGRVGYHSDLWLIWLFPG